MPILAVIFTFLFTLSILTYTKIQTFRDSHAFRHAYITYMTKWEHLYPNAKTIAHYREASKEEATHEVFSPELETSAVLFAEEAEKKPNLISMLGLGTLFEGKQKDLFIGLIENLYHDQRFYKELIARRPTFVSEILDRLILVEKPVRKKENLATLNLGDAELQEAFYKMLRGYRKNKPSLPDEPPSLLDYVTLGKRPVAIYLAPIPLLLAIYKDPAIVEAIVKHREEYKDKSTLKETFGNYPDLPQLNYNASTSNPKAYR